MADQSFEDKGSNPVEDLGTINIQAGIRSKLGANSSLSQIVELCKRRGFVFQTSEIYGGFSACYDFGPLGALMVQNLKDIWMRELVQKRRNVVSMDGAIINNPRVWEASGHVEQFNDPLVEDTVTHKRYRADHLVSQALGIDVSSMTFDELQKAIKDNDLKSPDGNPITDLKSFNLMVTVNLGATEQSKQAVYLRGETCQNIFVQFSNLVNSCRLQIPFGVMQIGKVFRNEVTTKQFILRTREFDQMEFEFFVDPADKTDWYSYWKNEFLDILDRYVGLPREKFRYRELSDAERSHYATRACDLEFQLENGDWLEVSPLNHRGDWDLSRHSQFSGKKLDFFSQQRGEHFTPHVIETSFGIARLFYLALDHGLTTEIVAETGEERTYLKLAPSIAPYKAAILPLSKKPELCELAEKLREQLSRRYSVDYDETGSIGKRYRRQDEIGTPFCLTVDFETQNDGCVTIRDRDTMQQQRIPVEQVLGYLDDFLRS